jgi:xylulokinase
MAGRVCPSQPDMQGTFAGLSWSHSRKQMFRAVMEGVALEYGLYLRAIRTIAPDTETHELRITGGGEKSRLWNLMKSSVLQIPVVPIAQGHGAPMGAAILAGVGSGLFSSAAEVADRWITLKSPIESDAAIWPFYERRVDKYRSLLDSMNRYYSEN